MAAPSTKAAPESTQGLPKTARILLVDDDERNLMALTEVLREKYKNL